jgi:hypothetical protein
VLYTITTQIAYMTPPFGYNLFLMRAMAPQGNHPARHLPVDYAVCPGDGAGACSCHGFPANRSLAA